MPPVLPSLVRATGRTGARLACSGALALGLLTTAPTTDAHGAVAAPSAHQQVRHHQQRPHQPPKARAAKKVDRAVGVALAQRGDPYSYGAAGPRSFDCSGLTYYSYRKAGFHHIPRTSSGQSHFAQRIKRSAMRRGDLIFFYDGGGVYHVGVYAGTSHGQRQVLHAPYSGTRVRTERLWTDRWYPGTLRFR